ncbi:MAG: hypothetical protein A3I61_19180 [Acidobacteria bacterium RIFCSPLOWO2_02_FULL_68_18]|nr:MAG: hypothetical protein A3I61_19180 [Acidobacteria bacterium RIFCSPLOWO2_02_FULL_68_18]
MKSGAVRTAGRYATIGGLAVWLGLAAAPAPVRGQTPTTPAPGAATDPIRCWWKSARSAVYVGERFPLTLTCSLVDTAAVRVVADQSRLDPAAVRLAPFDVVGGLRHPDIPAGPRRFLQYEYSLRIVADGLFGREVAVPAFDVHYRVQSADGQAAAVESMERTYRLPALPIRVSALVAQGANDIREGPPLTFDAIERRRFRGNVAFALAALLFSASLGCTAAGAARVWRRRLAPRAARLLSDNDILRGALREMERVERETARSGWTGELVGSALAAARVGAALALGQQPPQIAVDGPGADREGALVLDRGIVRRARLMVSASITAEAASPLRPALAELTAARYARADRFDGERLDSALADALAAVRRLRAERSWPARAPGLVGRILARRRG